ncbi:hypothetical protein AA0114_g12646 [Alternaria tenuissima]|nr:hypothetical protein AA0114_g12646 [Alternaria tenuissima]
MRIERLCLPLLITTLVYSPEAPTYGGGAWQKLNTVAKRAFRVASEKDASIVRQSLHHLAIQNTLLESENDGLRDALITKREGNSKGKSPSLLQHYEYWGPKALWTPRSFREAKVRMRQAKEAKDLDEKNKADMKELKKANKLYNDRIAEEKRKKAARDREAQAKAKADERKAINARNEQRKKDKNARDAQKAVPQSQRGKRKASQSTAPRKKQNRSVAAARSGVVDAPRSPTPPPKYNSRGRKIAPRKRLQ